MSFSLDLAKFIEKAKGNTHQVVKKTAISLVSAVIDRSPVGNPELWAANQSAIYARETYNLFVGAINDDINSNPSNFNKKGNLKSKIRLAREKSQRTLKTMFPLEAGKGYVGGRFRGNWQVTFDVQPDGTLERVDPQGGDTKAAAKSAMLGFNSEVGRIWVTNNLPYGPRLEFEGWSTQAPAGMVRISVTEFQTFVNQAIQELPQ